MDSLQPLFEQLFGSEWGTSLSADKESAADPGDCHSVTSGSCLSYFCRKKNYRLYASQSGAKQSDLL